MHYFGTKSAILVALLITIILEAESKDPEEFMGVVVKYTSTLISEKITNNGKVIYYYHRYSSSPNPIYPDNTDSYESKAGENCNLRAYQQWSPIFKSSEKRDFSAYKANHDYMVKNYLESDPSRAQDICFDYTSFMECSAEDEKCHCATTGDWELFKAVEIDNACYIGQGGRCYGQYGPVFVNCVNGTVCKYAGVLNKLKEPIFRCTNATADAALGSGYNSFLIFAAVGTAIMGAGQGCM